ncbi:ornithine cyclodeaminase family protein [Rhodococcus sp. NPDC056960]|uniref:ornithine cyclodeaminase family protein n=1 Tax=Rhodococcus sp. NPDC056960 TaxID=3345982 RepID=UPI0036327C1D
MIHLDARSIAELVDAPGAARHLGAVLRSGFDPEGDSARLFSPLPDGEFLIMPTAAGQYCGTKVLTLAPSNPSRGLPKIQGMYVLFDAETLAPLATLDGVELTLVRTPAVTTLAVSHLLEPRRPHRDGRSSVGRLVVFGTGPQAHRHIDAFTATFAIDEVVVVGRTPDKARRFVDARPDGSTVRAGAVSDVADADLILCATSSSTPLFDGDLVPDTAVVAAIGSHGFDARELDPGLVRRSHVFVEARASALREGGNLVPARTVDEWKSRPLPNVADLVNGRASVPESGPLVYNGIGMSWEDVVVASHCYEVASSRIPSAL